MTVVIRVKSLSGQVDAANHSFAGTRTANEGPESGFRIVVVTMVETTKSPVHIVGMIRVRVRLRVKIRVLSAPRFESGQAGLVHFVTPSMYCW
jgi:hypothetical protein